MTSSEVRRWPARVYDGGQEPDPRFSFANERTFLAWIRTALALIAGGVALEAFHTGLQPWLQTTVAALLLALGLVCAVVSWVRWGRAEWAMRNGRPLPSAATSPLLVLGVAVCTLALFAGLWN